MSARSDIVFYDGVCGLCDRTVQFLLKIDREQVLSFAPLQGEAAKRLKQRARVPEDLSTLLFAEQYGTDRERISTHSTGVLRILARIGGVWRFVSWLRAVPSPVRDFLYRLLARYRYQWFGQLDSCRLPDPETSRRFLD